MQIDLTVKVHPPKYPSPTWCERVENFCLCGMDCIQSSTSPGMDRRIKATDSKKNLWIFDHPVPAKSSFILALRNWPLTKILGVTSKNLSQLKNRTKSQGIFPTFFMSMADGLRQKKFPTLVDIRKMPWCRWKDSWNIQIYIDSKREMDQKVHNFRKKPQARWNQYATRDCNHSAICRFVWDDEFQSFSWRFLH